MRCESVLSLEFAGTRRTRPAGPAATRRESRASAAFTCRAGAGVVLAQLRDVRLAVAERDDAGLLHHGRGFEVMNSTALYIALMVRALVCAQPRRQPVML